MHNLIRVLRHRPSDRWRRNIGAFDVGLLLLLIIVVVHFLLHLLPVLLNLRLVEHVQPQHPPALVLALVSGLAALQSLLVVLYASELLPLLFFLSAEVDVL